MSRILKAWTSKPTSTQLTWLNMDNLAKADASSSVASACLARSCHAIARSVKHCRASPSARRTGSFCRETSNDRIVSRRGRRERRHRGHRNLSSRAAATAAATLGLFLRLADLGSGTHEPTTAGRWDLLRLYLSIAAQIAQAAWPIWTALIRKLGRSGQQWRNIPQRALHIHSGQCLVS